MKSKCNFDFKFKNPPRVLGGRHGPITGTCSKCGESIYAGQHRTRWRYQYHTYRCPDAETNAVIRALAPEHDWINAPEPPTRN